MKKSRAIFTHPDTNIGKLRRLDDLLVEYVAYVRICVEAMISGKTPDLPKSKKQAFFPPAEKLTSQIEKNARDHAIGIVSGWFSSAYTNKAKKEITRQKREGLLTDEQAKRLYSVGKYGASRDAEDVDAYWALLIEKVGLPTITEKIGMRLSEMTSRLESPDPEGAVHADLWLRVSSLESRKSIWVPLVGSPYIKSPDDASKGILARKTAKGRWRFETVETKDWDVLDANLGTPKVGVDVGLNVVAATSGGRLLGSDLKPKFDRLHAKVKRVRANRQRQGLKENSPRLSRLETRLSGLTKSATGKAANKLVRSYPKGTVFVVEDLDLRGCRGSKRFCYRALHHSLASKASVEVVNPAYTSQMCPSCGHVSRRNRQGIKFRCVSCGRTAHADVVGAINLLGRSEDKQVGRDDHPSVVGKILRERSRLRRASSFGSLETNALIPISRRLTTGVSAKAESGTASNRVVSFG